MFLLCHIFVVICSCVILIGPSENVAMYSSRHAYLWTSDERFQFLAAVGDEAEIAA